MTCRFLPLLTLLLLTNNACAGRRPPHPALVEDALAFAEMDRTKAIRLLEDAIATDDTGEDAGYPGAAARISAAVKRPGGRTFEVGVSA